MKETAIGFVCFSLGIITMCIVASYEPEPEAVVFDCTEQEGGIEIVDTSYDPNDPIFRYIPPADETWTEQFGDTERTRLIHSISEVRVLLANVSKRLMLLEDPNGVSE